MAALLIVGLLAFGLRYAVKSPARKRREAEYLVTVHSYGQILRPGITRKAVENYLNAKNLKFQQMCCVELRKNSWDDLVKDWFRRSAGGIAARIMFTSHFSLWIVKKPQLRKYREQTIRISYGL
jgi:hypothetical protein